MLDVSKSQRLFMASKGLRRPELVFDEDNIPMFCKPDYIGEFVDIKEAPTTYGLLSDWVDECCSDLHDEDMPEKEEDIFEVMTGLQLMMEGFGLEVYEAKKRCNNCVNGRKNGRLYDGSECCDWMPDVLELLRYQMYMNETYK